MGVRPGGARVIAVSAVALALLAVSTVIPSTEVTARTVPGCNNVLFIGLRGSGEPYDLAKQGMGDAVYKVYSTFLARAGDARTVRPYGLPYEARALDMKILTEKGSQAYLDSVFQGADLLELAIKQASDACPTQSILVVGYSQGAWAIGNVLSPLLNAPIAGVVLLGDPMFDPTASVSRGDRSDWGVMARVGPRGSYIPNTFLAKTRSYCHDHDPVCSFSVRDGKASMARCVAKRPSCVHFHYPDLESLSAGNFLANLLGLGMPASTSTVPPPTVRPTTNAAA